MAILLILWGINLWGPVQRVAEAATAISEAILFSEGTVVYRMSPSGGLPDRVLADLVAAPLRAFPARDGSGDVLSFATNGTVYRSPLDGQPTTVVVASGTPYAGTSYTFTSNIANSPDGTRLAYTAKPGGSFTKNGLYVSNVDGTGISAVNITGTPVPVAPTLFDWGPDGLLFKDNYTSGGITGQPLFVVSPSGGARTMLGQAGWNVLEAKYSHDFTKIALIVSASGGSKQLWYMNADGTGQTQISTTIFPNSVSWSPNGTELAVTGFEAGKEGEYGVYKVSLSTGTAVKLISVTQTPESSETTMGYVFWGGVAELRVPTTLTVSGATATVGNPVTLTAVIDPVFSGKTVNFSVNGASVGSAVTDAAGTATFTYTPALSAGTHAILAAFPGDSSAAPSTGSATLTLQPIVTSLSVSPASASYGGTATLTATLSPALSGKSISFTVAGTAAGSATTDASGVATLSYPTTQSAGNHQITATFAGETNYAASSANGVLAISPAATSLTIADTSATFAGTATVQATLSPALSGLPISFHVDGTLVGSGSTDGAGSASASFTVTQAGGTHTLSAAFAGNTNYQASGGSAVFTVNAAPGSLSLADASTPFKSPAALTATLTPGVAGKAITFTVGGTTVGMVATDASGSATYNYLGAEGAGTYSIGASFAGDASISGASDTGTLTVTQAAGSMSVSPATGTYLGSTTLRATLSPAAAGKSISFSVGGSGVGSATTDAFGVALLPYTIGVGAGSHPIAASFGGDADIASVSGSGTLTVSPAAGSMAVDNALGAYGDTVTLSATLSPAVAGKSVTFRVDGVAVASGITDGAGHATASYTITQAAGGHTLTAIFAGDSDISTATGSGTLSVNTATGSLTVAPATTTFRNPVTLSATLSPAIGGRSISFSVDGVVVGSGITSVGGTATLTYTPTNTVGTYTVSASWGGDAYVTTATGGGTLTIDQATGTMTVAAASGPYYGTTTLTATLSPGAAGKTVTFSVDGVNVGSAVTTGSGSATIPYQITNSVGSHTVTAAFAGDAEIAAATGTGTLSVTQATGAVSVAAVTGPFGGTATLQATLAPGVAGKSINFTVNGVSAGSAMTDGSGLAMVPYAITMPAGNYPILASFAGDTDISAANGSGSLTVEAAAGSMTVANVSGRYMSSVMLQANLSPAAALKTITFQVGGTTVGTATTNASGVATLPYTVDRPVGSHTILASFAGDSDISSTSASGTLTVAKADSDLTTGNVTIAYNQQGILAATLTDEFGTVITGAALTFTVNGNGLTATTDASGVATLLYTPSLAPAAYGFTVDFAGDANHNAAPQATGTLTVTKANTTLTTSSVSVAYNQQGSLTATLKDEGGAAVSGATVTFTVDGGSGMTATTDASGVATLLYTPTMVPGTYPVTVDFAATTYYNAASQATATLTVTKANTALTTSNISIAHDQTGNLTATLKDGGGAAIAGATVTFTVNSGAAMTATTDVSGVAAVSYTANLAPGTYPIAVDFAATTYYNAAPQATATLTVTKANTTLTAANVT
ncbi:MAG TPA: Ig-like domain repeat protein, partial [Symbiobacteriaceae bacterium]|nr:Ig-like domain repeat protein [Symbiobacteriaceae bacterium]